MKSINKTLLIALMAVSTASIFTACTKDNSGTPSISYIRITRPTSSDSLLVAAGQGQLIAIMGDNLQDAVEVWFNDRQARLTPTYITKTSLLVVVPSQIPQTITNKLKIVFKNGFILNHNFVVQISKPYVITMDCEFVNDGDVAIIRGDYFYDPVIVTFTGASGGVAGQIVSVKDQEIQVRVPAGVQPGPITVKTNFGETKSNFWFRDSRNHVIDSDPYEGWWDGGLVVSNPGPTAPPKISGNYLRYTNHVGAWSWKELAGGPASAMPIHSKNIPNDAILKPQDFYLKFEVNTISPYNGNVVKINVALSAEDNNGYKWNPPFDTKGKWQTVVIPLTDVFAEYNPKPSINPNGYWSRIVVGNAPGEWDADICFDNLRIVPKVLP